MGVRASALRISRSNVPCITSVTFANCVLSCRSKRGVWHSVQLLRKGEPVTTLGPQTVGRLRARRFAVNPIRASYANHATSAHHAYENTAIADSWRDQRIIGRRPDERRWVDDTEEDAGRRRCLRAG